MTNSPNYGSVNTNDQVRALVGRITANPPQAPTITAVNPNSGASNTPLFITSLTGTGFINGAKVSLTRTGYPQVMATGVSVVSPTRITCTLNLNGVTAGQWDVVVINTDGQRGVLASGFTVTVPPAPMITSLTPNTGASNTTVFITNLAGNGFISGAKVYLTRAGYPDVTASGVTVVSPAWITCTLNLNGVAAGIWDIVVTNTDGQSGVFASGFVVTAPPTPTVMGITPNSGASTTTVFITNLAGTGFMSGAKVFLTRSGYPEVTATGVTVVNSMQLQCTLDLTGAAVGAWDVVVINTDGQSGVLASGFTVTVPPAPRVTGITPNSGASTTTVFITNLAGTGFMSGAKVHLLRNGYPTMTAAGVTVASPTRITCTLNLNEVVAGAWDVVVINTDGQSGVFRNGFIVTAPPAPRVTGITPNSGTSTTTVFITNLAGTGFMNGAKVRLTRAGYPDMTATGVTGVSSRRITCTLDLAGAAVGAWDVVVINTDGQSGILRNGFMVKAGPAPKVTGITPNSGASNTTVFITNLAGTGFMGGAKVHLKRAGYPDVTATGVTVSSPAGITCALEITGAAVGAWDVVVINTDGQSGILKNGFLINPPSAPTIVSVIPTSGNANTSVPVTNLAGNGFMSGSKVNLRRVEYSDIPATNVRVVNPTQIACTLNLKGAAVGAWDVVVINTDGQSGILKNGFTVNPASAPTIVSVIPTSGNANTSISVTNLAGTGFMSDAEVKLTRAGYPNVTATGVTVVNPTQITCTLDLTGLEAGSWNVMVINADGQSGILKNGFTVNPAPAPTIVSVMPTSGNTNTSISVTNLAGTGFMSDAEVNLTRAGYPNMTATGVTVVNPTQITCTLDLTGMAAGSWNVMVINTDGQSGILINGFTVNPAPAPTIESITQSTGAANTMVDFIGLVGTGFMSGAEVNLTRAGYPNVTATGVTVMSPTQITCTLDLTGVAAGFWDVVVMNPDDQVGVLGGGFMVNPPLAPVLAGIMPSSGTANTRVSITNLAGSGFMSGAKVNLTKAGYPNVTATEVTVVDATQIQCALNLTDMAAGVWNVVVINTDGQSGILINGFTVNPPPAPAIVSITPYEGAANTTLNITDLVGTRFISGAKVDLTRAGYPHVTATGVTVVDPTQIQCMLDLTGVAAGSWDVMVVNPDGQSGILMNGIIVNPAPAPTVESITQTSGAANTTVNITDLAGTGFVNGAKVNLTRAGYPNVTTTGVMVVNPTQIICTLDLTGVAAGLWDVVVTNTDDQLGVLVAGFTVNPAPAPTVIGISPTSCNANTSVPVTNLAGGGFISGAKVNLIRAGYPNVKATGVTVVSSKVIQCTLDLTGATVGLWDVIVTNSDGQLGVLAGKFMVGPPLAPTVKNITPNFSAGNTPMFVMNLEGTGFIRGAKVNLIRAGYPNLKATGVRVASPTQIQCTLDLTGVAAGSWDIVVENSDGQLGILARGFSVNNSKYLGTHAEV